MEKLLGTEVFNEIKSIEKKETINEIRIRIHRYHLYKCYDKDIFSKFICDEKYINDVFLRAVHNSKYAYEEELSNGYIDYDGGIRIGIVGSCKISKQGLLSYKNPYSLCIRIPHEIIGFADQFDNLIFPFENTLVLSPPYCGKTTLIRDIARKISEKYDTLYIDERKELCGEKLTLSMGKRSDIVQGVPKYVVFQNIIRTMAPKVVVCDELFSDDDIDTIYRFTNAGIKCLASYHAKEITYVPEKLLNIFTNIITLTNRPTVGKVVSIVTKK